MRKIGIVAAILLVILAGAAWYLLSSVDSIVKGAIEKYGTEAAQASVTVKSVKLSLATGEATITGLVVGNPGGFATDSAVTLNSVTVKLDTGSLIGSGTIVIKQVDIVAPHVTYEVGLGGSNLQTIQKNVQAYAGNPESSGGTPVAASSGSERKLVIEDLVVRDGVVSVSATILQGRTLNVPLPTIHLTGIGKDGGATPAQVARQVLGSITTDAATVGARALANGATSAVTDTAKGVVSQPREVGKRLKSLFGD